MDLRKPLDLAGQNLLNALCPTRNYLPYWNLYVSPDYEAEYRFHWPAHNIGRWWDAMLRLEDATGFSIPGDLEGAMLANVHRFLDNPDCLCLAPIHLVENEEYGSRFELHSLREGLLALNALVRYRNSRWAAVQGQRMLASVARILNDDCSWDLEKLDRWHRSGETLDGGRDDLTVSHGRFIEALVWFHEATGLPLAFELAARLARYHLKHSTRPDGRIPEGCSFRHTHSYLGTLRGLLLFGLLANQHEYVETVSATYRVTVQAMIKESGFVSHDFGQDNRGETTSPGDAAQLALWLACHGYPEFLDDVERIVRARLIPAQISEAPPLSTLGDDRQDEYQRLEERIIGGIGGMHTMPHAGKNCVTDITCAVTHTLVDVFQHIVVPTDAGLAVYLHLNYEDDDVLVVSERGSDAKLTVTPKRPGNVLIRIPGWAPPESVQLTVNGKVVAPMMVGNLAYVSRELLPAEIVLSYALPARTTVELTDSTEYRLAWRGDDITGISPNSGFFPFYPSL